MKSCILFLILLLVTGSAYANHLKGGWIQYEYVGPGSTANSSLYNITVRQYLDCSSTAGQRDAQVYVGIYDAGTNRLERQLTLTLSGSDRPNKTSYSPCISSPPVVCYFIDRYTTPAPIELPDNIGGYVISVQRCCRIAGIANVSGNSSSIGVTYSNKIPGKIGGVDYAKNSSPVFAQKDTAIVCYNSPFTFDFSATDADGDDLVYYFCAGSVGGDPSGTGSQPNPPAPPPYTDVAYSPAFAGSSPMGVGVTIDPQTGIISGIAPSITGDYIVAVCAYEYRNGVNIGITKKEIHIRVANCSISAAALKPTYISCNGTTLTFQNESPNSSISSYLWDFGVPGITTDVSTSPTPTYDYLQSGKDSGTFTVKLVVASTSGCRDSATSVVKVYPGFVPDFKVTGSCFLNSYQFLDATTTKYGSLINWKWNFGDSTTLADTSRAKDSAWKYASPLSTTIKLVVSNTKGCTDSITKPLVVIDRPALQLAFKDTLICSNDTLALKANIGAGLITWAASTGPNQSRILNTSTTSPLVYPRDTTRYYVSVSDNGCNNYDTVTVNVLQYINVYAGKDTASCAADAFPLATISDALSYVWTSSSGEILQNTKYPVVQPVTNTSYYVLANLGKCQARDTVFVKVSPYPRAVLGSDTTICFGSRVQLQADFRGTAFKWTPSNTLSSDNTLSPIAGPSKTTAYIFVATDTSGCPKPATDTITVTVVPPVLANAGRDTTILPEMPVQLNAAGGNSYFWSPATGLSAVDIPNPVVKLGGDVDSVIYTVSVASFGCVAQDQMVVRIYKKGPDILVPSAFTPNGDGKNDLARPVTIGISKLNYFTIYNRWGEPVFSTNEVGKGWDGIFKGSPQQSGTYVYKTEGVDYLGQVVFRRGTVVLIR